MSIFKSSIFTTGLFNKSSSTDNITLAIMGDSTAAQGTSVGPTAVSFNNRGLFYWFLKQTNYKVNAPILNNLGVGAYYIDQVRTIQLPLVDGLTEKPTDMFIMVGTNDLMVNSLAAMQASYSALLVSTLAKTYLKRIWIVPITPRTTGMTTPLYQQRKDFNTWLADLLVTPATYIAAGLTTEDVSRLRILNIGFATEVDGDTPKTGYVVSDGLHHTALMAKGLVDQVYSAYSTLISKAPPRMTTSSDIFNSSTNLTGTFLNENGINRGLLTGTAGIKTTVGVITPTGDVADRWRLHRPIGTSTGTLVGSKGGVDANGFDSQIITYTLTGVGTASEMVQLEYTGGGLGILPANGIAPGQTIWAEGQFEVLSNDNILRDIVARIATSGTTPLITSQDGVSGETTIKLPTGQLGPYWFRTPLITLTSGLTGVSSTFQAQLDATGGTGSFSIKLNYLIVHQPYV